MKGMHQRMDDKKIVFTNAAVIKEDTILENGYVATAGKIITEIGSMEQYIPDANALEYRFSKNYTIVPGFIDVHIHGANGADTMDGTQEALETIAKTLPKEGTTAFLATTMTASAEKTKKALKNAAAYCESQGYHQAELLGIHLEGPFISERRAGAQHPGYILNPDISLFDRWQNMAKDAIRLVTVAPELEGGMQLVEHCKAIGVTASIGHSNARYDEALKAIQKGVTHCTHLFNGMRGLHHREPGAVGAVLLHEQVCCELISDGIHISPEIIKLVYRIKGKDGIVLVTDAMRAKCLGKGIYDLGGQQVTVDGKKAVLADGTLAGSILKMNNAVKNIIQFTGCSLIDAIHMATVNPAKQLGIYHRKGSIAVGKDADLVVLDDSLNVVMTFCRGRLAYSREKEWSV
jgi:N-acetylglucosamine-6-phosphate deacetylase